VVPAAAIFPSSIPRVSSALSRSRLTVLEPWVISVSPLTILAIIASFWSSRSVIKRLSRLVFHVYSIAGKSSQVEFTGIVDFSSLIVSLIFPAM